MTSFEAYHKSEEMRLRCAELIDTAWHYSWYWGQHPEERHWTMDALKDCADKIYNLEKQVVKLKSLRRSLEELCPFFYPEEDKK